MSSRRILDPLPVRGSKGDEESWAWLAGWTMVPLTATRNPRAWGRLRAADGAAAGAWS